MKKAIVFDNSGTLIERYRVIKEISTGKLLTDINSLDLIDSTDSLALVVLQFNTNKLLNLSPDTLISSVIKKYNIDFDISFSNSKVSKKDVQIISEDEKNATASDITDTFPILKEKVPKMELCNGSALIVDLNQAQVKYTITSSGMLFPGVKQTINTLKERGIDIFIASGDRKGAIKKLAGILDVDVKNAYGTVSTRGKCEIVRQLQNDGYKVMMVGDGLNDILAFNNADVSVLTVEQQEEVSPKMFDKTDFVINEISQVLAIDF